MWEEKIIMNTGLIDLLTSTSGMSYKRMVLALLVSCIISGYIFFVYRVVTKNAFYSKSFNITMAIMGIITTGIIIAMQSNLIISLGMVGALSIVRFRTAIKDPMDLLFLFWSIGIGLICGTELFGLAIIVTVIVSLAILLLDHMPIKRAPYLLVVNSDVYDVEDKVIDIVKNHSKGYKVKSRNITKRGFDMIIELRTPSGKEMVSELQSIISLKNISLLSHDGETRF